MPRATVTTETTRHELKSLEGAFVVLRPMAYGTKLARQSDAMRMVVKAEQGPRRRGQANTADTEITMLQKAATLIDFRSCVVDHNLEDEAGQKLDLSNPQHFDSLDPKVGEEVSTLIDELNNFEAGEEGNSPVR